MKMVHTRLQELPEERTEHAKIIAMVNNKGGCGKTSTTIALGLHLARAGYNIMFWDNDAQSNLTQRLGLQDEKYPDNRLQPFFRLMDDKNFIALQRSIPLIIRYPYLYKLPESDRKVGIIGIMPGSHTSELEATAAKGRLVISKILDIDQAEIHRRFRAAVRDYLSFFDYILIDTAPALEGSLLCQLAVKTADEIICPVDGLEAASGLNQLIGWLAGQTRPDQVKRKPNVLFALMKYQDDTVNIFEDAAGYPIKNAVFRAMKDTLGDFVCDNGIKELPSLRNQVYSGFGRKNQYEPLCEEIIQKISNPRPNLFDVWNIGSGNRLQSKLTKIEMKTLNKIPQFRLPQYQEAKRIENVES